ncbi:MAG: cytochrome c [Gallionella sp.]|nr:cytochrome c [Gallionella sp.]MDD4946329.1 cytochrome c [Gallionella sp.]MDD5612124.1 cytochrome c [Gallionella sp.]
MRPTMRLIPALLLLCAASAAQAAPFPNGNAQTGEKLFNQYKCNSCHAAMLGGDGSAIFTRADRKVHNPTQLIEQIRFCSGNVGAHLTPQEEQHLGAYLNRYYKLP